MVRDGFQSQDRAWMPSLWVSQKDPHKGLDNGTMFTYCVFPEKVFSNPIADGTFRLQFVRELEIDFSTLIELESIGGDANKPGIWTPGMNGNRLAPKQGG